MIFVTGASGNVGTAVVRCLRDRQVLFRIGARQPGVSDDGVSGDGISDDDIEVVPFNFLDASTFRSAVQGDDTLAKLLGHSSRKMRDYIRDHQNLWKCLPNVTGLP